MASNCIKVGSKYGLSFKRFATKNRVQFSAPCGLLVFDVAVAPPICRPVGLDEDPEVKADHNHEGNGVEAMKDQVPDLNKIY